MSAIRPARIELSAGGVIWRRKAGAGLELLLIKDSYGNWGFPKGHVEPGEGPRDAALRECREETGLERLRIIDELGTTDWYFRAGDALIHKFCDHFLVEAAPDEAAAPQHDEGIQACVWMSPEQALPHITYSNARHVAQLAVDRLSGGRVGGRETGRPAGGRRARGK